jgi:dihydrofolate reductase
VQIVSLIAAVGANGVIGSGGTIPWRLPADLRRFRQLTMGHPIIMGRKTYASIGKPLDGRKNIVISRDPAFHAAGCDVVPSLERALAVAGEGEVFIIGGGEIYRLALPLADRIYLTMVDASPIGDVFFPDFDRSAWTEAERVEGVVNEKNAHAHTFVVLTRLIPSP